MIAAVAPGVLTLSLILPPKMILTILPMLSVKNSNALTLSPLHIMDRTWIVIAIQIVISCDFGWRQVCDFLVI